MSGNRHTMPEILPGATEFSSDPGLADPVWAIRKLREHPQWLKLLLDGTDLNRNWGRPRIEGAWALAYMAFVVSGRSDVEPWAASISGEIWHECGFIQRPSYQSIWLRFAELEQVSHAFTGLAAQLIRRARKRSGNRVGRDLHIDSTEAETNAKLVHCCPHPSSCRARAMKELHPDEARELRQEEHARPPELESPPVGESSDGKTRIFKVGGCLYRSLDPTAGVRAYVRGDHVKSWWHGFYCTQVIDHYTGAPVAVMFSSASEQEYSSYPRTLDAATKALADRPRSVVADKGYSLKQVFEENTRRGIASVMPFRPRNQVKTKIDTDEFDRHGIPRCKRCGGETEFVRFAHEPYPRLWFRCLSRTRAECSKVQTIACRHDFRSLIPLWRIEPAYIALRESHQHYERVHNVWRARYRVGANTHDMRPKRRGIGCQQLRANAALLIEWLRILGREGWLTSPRRNPNSAQVTEAHPNILQRLLGSRKSKGLHLPYGAKAVELGIGPAAPPG